MTNKDNIDKTIFIKDKDVEERYWLNKLSGELKLSNFPYDNNKTVSGLYTKSLKFRFDNDIYEKLNKLSNDSYPRLHIILITGLTILLNKYTNNNDILLGTSIYNQDSDAYFINTILILRNKIKDDILFRELLLQVRGIVIEAEKNQNYPVDILLQKLKIPYGKDDTFPLFDVLILLENIQDVSFIQDVKSNVVFSFFKHNNYLEGTVNYNSSLYEEKTILRIISHYQEIFRKAFIDINTPVADLDILSTDERKQILYDFNNTKTEYPKNKTIHELFEEQALKTPNNTSLEYNEDKLSYEILNSRSNQVAKHLRKLGVNTNSIVGIMLENSFDLITGILGILKAGAAYLPIDISYPQKRKEFIINDSNLDILLSNKQLITDNEKALQNISIENLININDLPDNKENSDNLERTAKPSDICYVIYTSGSTGNPKGVSIKHQGLTNYIYWATQMYNVPGRMNFPLYSSVSFDLTVTSIYTPLITGNKIIIYNETNINETLEKIFQNDNIGVVKLTPAHLSVLDNLKIDNSKVRKLIVGGDQLTVSIADKIHEKFDGIELYNEYGPTEAVVGCMIYKNNPELDKGINVPIGKPISNVSIYILDNQLKPVCDGVSGEMFIGGDGLSLGYINKPELSKTKFIKNPFTEVESLYCTGDLARRLPDGNIEFLGRIDDQVKIRGYRIELGEIEHVLQKHENIQESVVLVRDENEDKYLCAYIVPQGIFNQEEIYSYLSTNLPEYMMPSYFVEMEVLPLTLNGKVDKKSLPSPKINASNEYVAPSNYIEEKLAAIWSEIIDIPQLEISVNANFFTIGGHSLKATILIGRINKEFDVEFPLHDVFLYSTIKEQASQIEKSTKKEFVSIPKAKEQSNYPLSSAQKRLYLLQQMDLSSIAYNIPYIISLSSDIDKEKINYVFKKLIARHESFRTSFELIDEVPVQSICEQVEFTIEEFTIEEDEVQNRRQQFIQSFDLSKAPLLRVAKVNIKGERSLLMIDMHHIISDGVSHTILEREFHALYSGEELPPLSLQYKDYSEWQISEDQQQRIKGQENYWLKRFEGEIPVLNLPTDYIRPVVQSHEGARVRFTLSKEETKNIKLLAKENDLTLYMSLLSVFTLLLSKLSGQSDIIVGIPIAGRSHTDLENIVGMFVNTLAIRNEVKGDETIKEFVTKLKQVTLDSYANQSYQFEDLVDKVSVARNIGRNPIFDVMFNLLNQAEYSRDISGTDNENLAHTKGVSKFDITITAVDYGEQISFNFEYCTQLFKAETIDRFILYFKQIVGQLGRNSEIKISTIDILTEEEKHRLLYEFNNTKVDYPKDKTIHQLFEEQVDKCPDKIALECKNKAVAYQELNEESNQIAHYLIEKGLKREDIVGIELNSSYQYVACMFAVLKSGGAFLPIDKKLPDLRKKYIIENSELKILIHNDISYEKDTPKNVESINLQKLDVQNYQLTNPSVEIDSFNLAYIIYTSGSTGKPKGTLLEHKGIVSENIFWKESLKINPDDRCLQFSNISFDASVWEIYLCLFNGASLYIPDENIKKDTGIFEEYLVEKQITVATLPPPFADTLNESIFKNFRLVITAGSETNSKLIEKISKNTWYINAYGPTETSVCATYWDTSEYNRIGKIAIGRPIQNIEAYILDSHLQLQGIGISGELCFSGEGLARGYLKNPELTAEKFISHPFKEGECLYRTGDLARWLPDGNIEFLGRIDHQVKIRGYRIELGEIESTLLKYENIEECVVLARDEKGEKYLCAYIVSKEELNHEELRAYVSAQLPDYMVPSLFVELESLPLTTNGKVNRKALPSPEIKAGDDYVAPFTETEEKLVEIWSKVLNINKEDISVIANFFSIGGHSLKATALASNIHKEIGVEFPLHEVFVHPTIKSQAGQIEKSTKKEFVSIPKAKEQSNYPVSSAQKRMYLLQQFDLTSTVYNMPYIIPLGKEADKEKIEEVFKQLINRHENFRTSFIVVDQEPVQFISKNVAFEVEVLSIENAEIENTRNKFIKPFDLSKAPFLRVAILDIKGEDSLLMIDMHHIISDGISHIILEKEFQSLFSGEELAPLPLQYKDYSQWQNSKEQQELINDQEQYWLNKFEGEIPILNLPTDYVRPLVQSHEGATVSFVLSKEETEEIRFFTKENDLTLYMSLLSLFNILLSKLSGQNDIVVGTPIASRNHADLENIVGMFINTLSIRSKFKGEESIRDFVSSLKQTVLGAYENQNYQFEDLVDKISLERDTGRNPIFDVVINLLNQAEYSGDISGINNENLIHTKGVSKFDLTFTAIDYGEQLLISFNYCTQLFKAHTIDRFIEYFKKIISQLARKPEIKISEIDILTEAEKHQLLYEFNNTKVDYPKDKTIHHLYEDQVSKNPDRISVSSGNVCISYNELNIRSNQLAWELKESGVEIGDVVGLNADRTEELIIGILGILKCGAAYLPVNSGWPKERINFMLSDSCCTILIHGETFNPDPDLKCRFLDINNVEINKRKGENLEIEMSSSDILYIIYTSGTTGNPKGVLTTHMNVSRVVLDTEYISINSSDNILQLSSYTFDGSVFDIYGALLNGSSLVMINNDDLLDIGLLLDIISKKQISIFFLTTALFNTIVDYGMSKLKAVRKILFGGERISVHHTQKALKELGKGKLVHVYGPTETTVFASYHNINAIDEERETIPIGTPLSNTSIYLFDSREHLVPKGVSGEIYIGGCGNAKGYLNNPELTNDKFVTNPYNTEVVLYRTGDLARFLSNGSIEFLGRIDHQVKIRGFRIELGEIESTLLNHENIKESVVLAIEKNNEKYLCAYVVSKEELNHEELRAYVSVQLPDYMIPSYFVELESLPLNANGKVNRKVLPSPEIIAGDDYVAPSNEIEEKLVQIWSEVLNINKEDISVKANFFSIGGHSLKATVLTSKIHKEIGVEFLLREVFLHSTIKSQASQIEKSTKKEFVSIPKAKEQSNYPLSSAQKRLYLLQQFDLTSTVYNMPYAIPLGKEANKSRIEDIFKQLINRHESFRTSIIVVDNEPVQLISKDVEFELEELSIENTEVENIRNKFIKPFDLSQAPFLRVAIVHVKGEDSLLMIDMHHIISDGTSHAILEKEFQALFSGEELAPLPLQYKDYSQWQNSKEQQEHIKNQEQYWLNKFEGEIPVLNLPIDYMRPSMQSHEGATVNFVLSEKETDSIKLFTKENDLTLYMSLLSVFSILLSKLSGQDDIIVGTPIAGRNHADLEDIVGMFVNTLSIRNEVKGEETIREFISSLKQTVLGAYENQNYQFEDLVEKLSIERDTSRNPIFDVMFNLLNQTEFKGSINEDIDNSHNKGTSKFDLNLTAIEFENNIYFNLEYSTRLFKVETINRIINYFKDYLKKISKGINLLIGDIQLIREEEKEEILKLSEGANKITGEHQVIQDLFRDQVVTNPLKTAVKFENIELNYDELNKKSNQLASLLRSKGIKPNDIVGLMLDRSLDLIIGVLGIIKSGGAYLPIDVNYPDDRKAYMLENSGATLVLIEEEKQSFEVSSSQAVEFVNISSENLNQNDAIDIEIVNKETDILYVIYTSGSTGKPKGVMLEHRNLVNLINNNENTNLVFDRVLQFTSISFDVSFQEIFSTLLSGGQLFLISEDDRQDINKLFDLVEKESIETLFLPTSYAKFIFNSEKELGTIPESIKHIITAGEQLVVSAAFGRYLQENRVYLHNHYGPTESHVVTTITFSPNEHISELPSIGKPIQNTSIYILDESKKLQPTGIVGEIYIGGIQVARGYLRNNELTAEKFIDHSFKEGERLYRTGDLARWLPDGNIEFLGRIDHQIKIRGFRIELGEIESVLQKHEIIKESVVIAREENEDKYLYAYLVTEEGFNQEEIHIYLSTFLPDYMIPSYFVEMDKIPLTSNGKVNRKALPLPEIKAGDDYVVPSNEIEEKLVKIWSEVLNVPQEEISTTASFFAIGGHSLKATILVSKIHKELSVKLPLKEVFQQQTIKKMAVCISKDSKLSYSSIKLAEKKEYHTLSSAQKRLYFIQQMDFQSISYNMPMLIPLSLDIKTDSLENAFTGLVSRHESFRTSFIKINNEPVQRIYDKVDFKLDNKETTRENLERDIKEYIKPFNLSKDILIRACVMHVSNEQNVLVVDMHHIISDGTTSNIVREDFLKLFNGEKIAPLKLQYKDFSNWQNTLIEKGGLKSQESYWKDLFSGDIPTLNLQTDYKRPESFTFKGDVCRFSLDEDETSLLRDLGKGMGSTLYMNILAVLNTLFYRFSNQEDIIIGSGIAGRQHSDLLGISGMFVNTLAMRNYPNGDKTYLDFLKEVSDNSIAAFENQDIQFEDLVDMLNINRDISRNPLFDISMVVQNFGEILSEQEVEDVKERKEHPPKSNITRSTSKFDMTFFVSETVNKINIAIEYYTDIFKRETIEKYIRCFKLIVNSIIKNPAIKLNEIELLSQEEKQQLLYDFNDTQLDYPKNKTIHELFEEQVEKSPDNMALVCDQEQITYRELDKRSNQIAQYLRYECEVGINESIGIYMDKGANALISILGILKTGCGYLPLSVSYPEERLIFMINDTSTQIIFSEKRYLKEMNKFQWECSSLRTYICMDSSDIYGEQETQSKLNDRKLWEYVGDESVDEVTGGGWSSSYTGEPIPQEEMDEYGDNVLKKLEPHLTSQTRILEIGCASGISMFRLAPKVALYYGTDLSGTILQKNEERINSEGHDNIIQKRLSADEIDQIDEKGFDLVIINSVIQCFDGHNYLKKVIRKAIDLMKPEGLMFLGDIMDQDLKYELKQDLEEFKKANTNKEFKTKTDWSEELFLSRGFWDDLKYEETSIERIASSSKIFTLENELTKYRYDVLLSIDKNQEEIVSVKNKNKFQHDLNILRNYSTEKLQQDKSSDNLAYIIYTSGSTGRPKGVAIKNSSLVNLCIGHNNLYGINQKDHINNYAEFSFDASVWEIFPSIIAGASLYFIDDNIRLDSERVNNYFEKKNITISFLPTQFCEIFMEYDNKSLRVLLTGGDKLNSFTKRRYKLYNNYGPTENTVVTTRFEVQKPENNIPIGKPIENSQVYILDQNNQLQSIGVPGELCVSGEGLAIAYLNNPELYSEKFIDHPFKAGERLYRTGDLARWLPDGNIEFLGRIDHQVKIRGFRIELGEIENVLLKHENIKECVVTAIEENNEKSLCAYVVCTEECSHKELRAFVSSQLPDNMIPSYFVELESLPLTTNGKVNRKALPSPEIKAGDDYVAPSDEIEEKLVKIWSDVLNINKENISVNANFFSMGGHSLKATVLTSKIHKEIGVEFPLREVFVHSTIKSQASQIEKSTKKEFASIPKAKEQPNYPLSSAQKRLYLLQQFDLKSTAYNMPYIIPLGKELDKLKIEEVFKQLINRHESFRTSIIVVDNEPVQIINKNVEFELEELCIESTEVEQVRNKFIKPFDLSKAPFLRVFVVDIKGKDSLLLVDMHHIISDGTTHAILEKEFRALFLGEELAPLPLQYKDYSQWQKSKERQEIIKDQEQYWLNKFEGEIPVLSLPTDYIRPLMQSHEGATVNFVLSKEETKEIKSFTKENDLTLYMSLLSVFSILLSKLSGQEDIIVGTPIAGRNHLDLENIVGMFVNTLSIRNEIKAEETIQEFVSSLKQTVLGAYENQNYQFEDLVEKVSVERDTSRNPIFDVMFNLLNQTEYDRDLSEINNQKRVHEFRLSKFDLTLTAVDYGDQLLLNFQYCTQLFKSETIDRFIVYFKQIVKQFTEKAEIKISVIDILTEEEKHQLLYEFNDTQRDYPKDKTIHQLFEEQALRTPESVALIYNNTELTYRELNQRSNQLSHLFIYKGLKPGNIVSIMLDRSIEMIVGILSVLKAGGAYCPIDLNNPEERIKYILEDSKSRLLLTRSSLLRDLDYEGEIVYVDNFYILPNSEVSAGKISKSKDLAYLIYTSGTTGKPKGVMIRHDGVVNTISWYVKRYKLIPGERLIQLSNYSFDASVNQIFGTLTGGASLYIIEDSVLLDLNSLYSYLGTNNITVINSVPTILEELISNRKRLPALQRIISGGEKLSNRLKDRIINLGYELHNHYGPTEGTIVVLAEECSDKDVTLGKPKQNTQSYILSDSYDKLLPIGVKGELCISGEGISQGYLNNEYLTKEKFILHPFKEGERLYRTGDLARWLPDGNIEFLGRIDHQVKIRGFRIELGEIESGLLKHENINECVVTVIEENNEKSLCAYVVCKEKFNHEELRVYMSEQLPDYMVPSYFVKLESLPLNANGKVNRKILPSPQIKAGDGYVAPSNETEEKLVEIWAEVLKIEREDISTTANFFAIGGHSLKASSCINKIKSEFNINIPLVEIFKIPTISHLANFIQINKLQIDIDDDHLVLLKEGAVDGMNIFLIHDGSGDVDGYIEFCKQANDGINYWGIKAGSLNTYEPFNITIEQLAIKYIKSIKKVQKQGEYNIAGWSLGGTIAFEIIKQLEQEKENVRFFGIIDSMPPNVNEEVKINEFTVESELDWIRKYFDDEVIAGLNTEIDLKDFWVNVIAYLKNIAGASEILKYEIAKNIGFEIKEYKKVSIENLVKYMNFTRSLSKASYNYSPENVINTRIIYFAASESKIIRYKNWNTFATKDMDIKIVKGSHFSIFNQPNVKNLYNRFFECFMGCESKVLIGD